MAPGSPRIATETVDEQDIGLAGSVFTPRDLVQDAQFAPLFGFRTDRVITLSDWASQDKAASR